MRMVLTGRQNSRSQVTYVSHLFIEHKNEKLVELRRLELRTSDRKITLAVARQRTLGR
jgi:hypothetical protein